LLFYGVQSEINADDDDDDEKLYSLTNTVRAVQSKLRNSKNHFGVDTRYLYLYASLLYQVA